ncbi:MAG TPA: hypothetical protein VHX19_00600 [Stellaceae bacterium]|nr:hypothetical protein [Stellaceae bacterium]
MSNSVDDELEAIKRYIALMVETRDQRSTDVLCRLIQEARARLADAASKASAA